MGSANEQESCIDGESRTGTAGLITADVKSIDNKHHRIVYDKSKEVLEFTLNSGTRNETYTMVKKLSELVCVRGTPITLRRGIPTNLNLSAKQADTPNSLFFYFAVRKKKFLWRIREVVAIFTTSSEKKHWLEILTNALHELKQRPKRVLVVINPYGGKGKAKKIYKYQVEMILAMADVKCDVLLTQRANHALDHLRQLDASDWSTLDGVISVGGDGLFNECMSAIICRAQEEAGKDITDVNISALETPRMRFGIIGAGSANSIVSSVHGTDDCSTAAIHIAIGSQCSVDVCTVHRGDDLMRVSANAISYGWLGDALADSERYRWMGPIRYKFSALCTTFRNPSYFGRVSFRLTPEAESQKSTTHFYQCSTPCEICDGTVKDDIYPYHVQTDFTHVICCVNICVSPFTPYGLAPYAGVADGTMDLAVVPRISRCENITFMRRVAMHGGRNVAMRMKNHVGVYRVSQWSFTPSSLIRSKVNSDEALGNWNLDGEILPQPDDAAFHFRLHPQLILYFGRELNLNDPKKNRRAPCCGGGPKEKRISKIITIQC
ncbi:hypothetical protein AB6A40_005388 [Gnathostoma spinigerum]|uniref:DAGKc domain-containing protein n=1 Tax=Gnathostoma spinigerum TaxID=75299 RepID=A0ABD6EMY2_9BILA